MMHLNCAAGKKSLEKGQKTEKWWEKRKSGGKKAAKTHTNGGDKGEMPNGKCIKQK